MNEIQLYTKLQDPIAAVTALGKVFAKSGFAGCDREEQGQFLALVCLSENKTPTELLRTFDIVEGKLRKKAVAALAEFNSIGGKHVWISTGEGAFANENDRFAELQLALDGQTIKARFSIADAIRGGAQLKSKNGFPTVWAKNPANMLRARCITNGVQMLAPGIFGGDIGETEPHNQPQIQLSQTVSAPVAGEVLAVIDVQSDDAAESAMGLAPISPAATPPDSLPVNPESVTVPDSERAGAAGDSTSKSTPPAPKDGTGNLPGESASGVASLSDELENKLCEKFDFLLTAKDGTEVDSSVACREFLANQKGEFSFPLNKSLREMKASTAEKIIASPRFVPAVKKFIAEKKQHESA